MTDHAEFQVPPAQALATRVREAIGAYLSGVADLEGASPLDRLVADVKADPSQRTYWSAAIIEVAQAIEVEQSGWWRPLEFVAVLADLLPSGLQDVLETVIAGHTCPDPEGRASIYSLMAELGRPPTARLLWDDQGLRQSAPLMWLDLILPMLPDLEMRQNLVLTAVRDGSFTIESFDQRRDDMRLVGGARLGDWLLTLRDAFRAADQPHFDVIVQEAFGLGLTAANAAGNVRTVPLKPVRIELRSARPTQRLVSNLKRSAYNDAARLEPRAA